MGSFDEHALGAFPCERPADGFGALVTVKAGALSLLRRCGTDGSYLSASEARVHFGLGQRKEIESLEIAWPSGAVEKLEKVPANEIITVKEGAGIVPRKFPRVPDK